MFSKRQRGKAVTNEYGLTIDCVPNGRSGTATLTARLGDEVLAVESLNLTKRKERARFVDTVCDGRPGISRKVVEDLVLQLAGDQVDREEKRRPSQATVLVNLTADAELWHTPDGDAYATVSVDEHRENWPVRSRGFKRWLARQCFVATEKAASSQAVNDALAAIEGQAVFDGPEHDVHVRVAERNETIYIDLGTADWRVVEVAATGWQVVEDPPVKLRRAKAMMPLPSPVKDGSVDQLRQFINVSDEDWPLVVAWLLAAMRPVGPYPVLCLHGEQGSAKTTTARVLRSLVDPNSSPVRCEPREPRDLMIAAKNGWVIALDNLSRLPVWLSDGLCRLSTGGGFSTRMLYENDEEIIFDSMRPVILNGIEELATRGDLLDRSLLVNLPAIPEHRRRNEAEFWGDFERVRPVTFGAMLDAVSEALRNVSLVTFDALPRMADFALWAMAGETALGLDSGQFMAAYSGNREAGNDLALEASPVARVVREFVLERNCWTGTASDLLGELEGAADENIKRLKSWPKAPQSLSGQLKRLAPNLRHVGVEVEFGHEGRGRVKRRVIALRKLPEKSVPTVPSVPTSEKTGSHGDDGVAEAHGRDAAGTQTGSGVSRCLPTMGTHGDDGDDVLQPLSCTDEEQCEWTA
jgi:hypothetical protein